MNIKLTGEDCLNKRSDLAEKMQKAFEEGKYEECLKSSEEILQINEEDFNALSYKGTCLEKLGRQLEAIGILSQCLSVRNDLFFIWSSRGDCFYTLKKYAEAAEDHKKALDLDPNNGSLMHKYMSVLLLI